MLATDRGRPCAHRRSMSGRRRRPDPRQLRSTRSCAASGTPMVRNERLDPSSPAPADPGDPPVPPRQRGCQRRKGRATYRPAGQASRPPRLRPRRALARRQRRRSVGLLIAGAWRAERQSPPSGELHDQLAAGSRERTPRPRRSEARRARGALLGRTGVAQRGRSPRQLLDAPATCAGIMTATAPPAPTRRRLEPAGAPPGRPRVGAARRRR